MVGHGQGAIAPQPNPVRHAPTGIDFARARPGGKLIRRPLKTADVLSAAQLRL